MKAATLELIALAALAGLALFEWERSKGAGATMPPADQLYHPATNPRGYVLVPGQGWIAADPQTGTVAYYGGAPSITIPVQGAS